MSVDFDVRGQQQDFFTGDSIIMDNGWICFIMDFFGHFGQQRQFNDKTP